MRALVLCCLAALPALSQTATDQAPELPKEPLAILRAAAPHYHFNDGSVKPFHLKATYQLYDNKGQPSEKGSFEYWWVSPEVNRRTWTRPGATHSDWQIAGGKHAYLDSGERLRFFEYKLQSALFSPLPREEELNPARSRFERQTVEIGKVKLPCVEVVPMTPSYGRIQEAPTGIFQTYCFDLKLPALRLSYAGGALTTAFDKIAKLQDRYLAREIEMLEGKRKLLTAEVETVTGLKLDDPELTPPADASHSDALSLVAISAGVAQGFLIKNQTPVYPNDAKQAGVSGKVVIEGIIGMDGAVHDLHVVSAPSPSLAASALLAVSHWEYKPYILNGQPVEVKTTINVIFSLGG